MGLLAFVLSGMIIQQAVPSEAVRCLKCDGVPDSNSCTTVTECSTDEYCLTEQLVTSDGHVVYNVGCIAKGQCTQSGSLLLGKRSTLSAKRDSSSIVTCMECCIDNFCNTAGCGIQSIPLGQRGPICFNCASTLDPKACEQLAVCDTTEECMVYSPPEYSGLPQTIYKSQCENKAACATLSQVMKGSACDPKCCSTDFCNTECTNNTSTIIHVPTQPTKTTAKVPQVGTCKKDHYQDDITGMCIYIDETRLLNHDDAKKACESIGDELIIIDTHEKDVFVENMILHHTGIASETDRRYWVGLTDLHDNSVFYWGNGQKLVYENWGGGDEIYSNQQPDDDEKDPQNCVMIYGRDHYRWHDDRCSSRRHYICEDRSFVGHIGQQTGTNTTTNTFQCNTHGGYIHLKNTHADICVHIHTNHADWTKSRSTCQSEGGDLVILDDADKAHLIRNEVSRSKYGGQMGYWIGASDVHKHNKFVWVNGSPVTYGDWHKGQPNHHDGGHDQDCACLWSTSEHYQWHDDYCPKPLGFVCERRSS